MNHDDHKTTPDRVSTNVFRTLVNPKSPSWSPIFHATTPDLSAPEYSCKGTPALMQRLGINQELDVSWSAVMETPPNPNLNVSGIVKLDALKRIQEKPKPLQPCTLFHEERNNIYVEKDTNKSAKLMEEMHFSGRTTNLESEKKKAALKSEGLLNLLKTHSQKFIYPEPIYINIHRKSQITNPIKHLKQQQSEATMEKNFVPKAVSKQNLQKGAEETKTSHDFSHDFLINGHRDISLHTSDHYAFRQTEINDTSKLIVTNSSQYASGSIKSLFKNESHDQFHVETDDIETVIQPRPKAKIFHASSSCNRQQYCDTVASRIVSDSVGFSIAKEKNATVSEKAINLPKSELEEFNRQHKMSLPNRSTAIDYNTSIERKVPEKAWDCVKMLHHTNSNNPRATGTKINRVDESSLSAATEHPKLVGFSTAAGKKLTISETAMIRAKANLEEIANDDFTRSNNQNIAKNHQNRNVSSHTGIQENTGNNDETLFHNSNEAAIPKTVGFCTAGGKKVTISEKAIAQAKCFLSEFEDCDAEPIGVPLAAGFSMASGKKVVVSKEAFARGQALLDEVCGTNAAEENSIGPQATVPNITEKSVSVSKKITVTSTDYKMRGQTSFKPPQKLVRAHKPAIPLVEINHAIPLQVPLNVGFNIASGKEVKTSESLLCRAPKTFEEIPLVEDIDSKIEIREHVPSPIISPPCLPAKNESADNKTRMEDKNDHDDYWVSSPTIGKKTKRAKKRKNLTDSPGKQLSRTPISGTPSAFDSSAVSSKIRALRRIARQEQTSVIQCKQLKFQKASPKAGYLYQLKQGGPVPKKTWTELVGSGSLPEMLPPYQLLEDHGILTSVCLVQASNAASFNFCAWDHFPIEDCLKNSKGMQLGEFLVIFSDENTIGCEEIGASLLATENVDPTLINCEWIRNHYRWIVWKLASMELRLPSLFARTGLTLANVLEQLKYRYDREIDHCQRPALRRIVEQDDTAAKTMILSVAEIRTPMILELTDGWYSIDTHCDSAMQQLIEKNKIFVGVKLIISGAELVSPGPVAPLEKGSDTYLKISANSTRRARWDSKLGVCSKPLPFPIALASILPDGGVVSHIRVHIIRVYPLTYMEKASDGKTVFRGERQYRRITESAAVRYERMMEKVVEDIEREEDEQERKRLRADGDRRLKKGINLTDEEKRCRILAEAQKRMQMNMKSIEGVPMLKLRVVDGRATSLNSAIVSIWRPTEELQHHLKEGRVYRLYNVNAAGLRFGELQLNAMKNTLWSEMKQATPTPILQDLARRVTPFSTANQLGFKPMFNELDIVGLVVYVGQQQSKGPFQTAVLSDGSTYFGVKCWASLEDYALADVIVAGAFLAFSNLQWRATACRTASKLQFAFIHEGTLVSSRPALKHLDAALHNLKQSVKDPGGCVTEAEGQVDILLGSATPQQATPKYGNEASGRSGMFTPTGAVCSADGKKNETPTSSNLTINRARLLEKYPDPPALSPWNGCASPLVRKKFKPPARKASAT